MDITLSVNGNRYAADLKNPLSIAIPVRFDEKQVSAFGAPPAHKETYKAGSFVGAVAKGGSCNCETYTVTPHCNGTHTESIGHIAKNPVHVCDIIEDSLVPATLLTVTPETQNGDLVITKDVLERALTKATPGFTQGLIVRTLPNDAAKTSRNYGEDMPPYFVAEALALLKDVQHLLCDLPSVDRMDDGGKLAAHRAFWGVAPGETAVAPSPKTITELVFIPEAVTDGAYLLNLQVAAFKADAAPSNPVLYKVSKA